MVKWQFYFAFFRADTPLYAPLYLFQVIDSFHKGGPPVFVYIVITTALIIPYTFVRDLKNLAPFSTFANLLNFVGLIIIFQDLFQGLPNPDKRPAYKSLDKLPLYFGTAIYAFEGIGLVCIVNCWQCEKVALVNLLWKKNYQENIVIALSICLSCSVFFKHINTRVCWIIWVFLLSLRKNLFKLEDI